MRYRIEFTDDLMQLLDENNHGHDAHIVTAGREGVYAAKMKINEWRTQYEFDSVKAKREVNRLVEKM
jgi:hypothetical protein